jgi:hypothetical protein
MNPFEMVVAIIIVVTIGKVLSTRYRAQNGIIEDRVAVLEKIATDDRGARELENEIEKLRDR